MGVWDATAFCRTFLLCSVYSKTANHRYCSSGDLTNEKDCRIASKGLGLQFATSFTLRGDHRYCFFADDGRNVVFFNEAGTGASSTPPNPRYASLCGMSPSISQDAKRRRNVLFGFQEDPPAPTDPLSHANWHYTETFHRDRGERGSGRLDGITLHLFLLTH